MRRKTAWGLGILLGAVLIWNTLLFSLWTGNDDKAIMFAYESCPFSKGYSSVLAERQQIESLCRTPLCKIRTSERLSVGYNYMFFSITGALLQKVFGPPVNCAQVSRHILWVYWLTTLFAVLVSTSLIRRACSRLPVLQFEIYPFIMALIFLLPGFSNELSYFNFLGLPNVVENSYPLGPFPRSHLGLFFAAWGFSFLAQWWPATLILALAMVITHLGQGFFLCVTAAGVLFTWSVYRRNGKVFLLAGAHLLIGILAYALVTANYTAVSTHARWEALAAAISWADLTPLLLALFGAALIGHFNRTDVGRRQCVLLAFCGLCISVIKIYVGALLLDRADTPLTTVYILVERFEGNVGWLFYGLIFGALALVWRRIPTLRQEIWSICATTLLLVAGLWGLAAHVHRNFGHVHEWKSLYNGQFCYPQNQFHSLTLEDLMTKNSLDPSDEVRFHFAIRNSCILTK